MRAKDISICAYVVAYHRPFSGARASGKCYFMLHLQQVSVYRIWHQAPRRCISGKETAADLMQAVSHYAWLPEDWNYRDDSSSLISSLPAKIFSGQS